jgi:MFS family permease
VTNSSSIDSATPSPAQPCAPQTRQRTLALSGLAHALHDGYTDAIYVLLPVWRAEFGLDYVALAMLRGLYAGAMAALQVPASWLADHVGGRAVLILGTLLASAGYALAGFSGGAMGLYAALLISGAGSSVQHPIASSAVARAYGSAARGPLGTYNFTGDLGKAIIPAALSLGLAFAPWRPSLWVLALAGVAVAALLVVFMPPIAAAPPRSAAVHRTGRRGGRGFPLLLSIGVVDTGVRMGFLTFLPFLLQMKGASQPLIGTALALVFLGGAAGKLACGWLAQRWGSIGVILCTEGLTALMIALATVLPLLPLLMLLPLLGLTLNGTSSVLYGTVPELAPADRTERAFAIFYTGVIGSGALSPLLFGALGDQAGPVVATLGTAAAALINLPLALALGPRLARR